MTKSFPNFVKEKVIPVQEVQSPKQNEPKEAHTRHIIIKMAKVKDKERILKALRESSHKTVS